MLRFRQAGRVGRFFRRAGRLFLAVWLAVMVASPVLPEAQAARRWPPSRCYISGTYKRQLCYCGQVRYPMWFCTRTRR